MKWEFVAGEFAANSRVCKSILNVQEMESVASSYRFYIDVLFFNGARGIKHYSLEYSPFTRLICYCI